MVKIVIGIIQVLFAKFFASSDVEKVLVAVPEGTKRVVFIDTPSTPSLVTLIEVLFSKGIEVFVRDHHNVLSPRNPREEEIAAAVKEVREMVGENAIISDRVAHPACSSLIEAGQFNQEGTVIVADPDLDGLLGAMKACGVVYSELDSDADVLDGGRANQTADKLSPFALLITRAMASLPPWEKDRPQISEDAKVRLFGDFILVVQGDPDARLRLEKGVEVYEAGVREAERLLTTVSETFPGLSLVDIPMSPRFDLATLARGMESRPGTKVTVQRKTFGPIAKVFGVQYSIAVARPFQAEINLQELLPAGFVSSPETGIISNTSFLLHVSEKIWTETVLPALRAKLA